MTALNPDAPLLRYKTAMARSGLSRPLAIAIDDGLVTKETTVFDYGCGRGGDVRELQARGISCLGWDPHYAPAIRLQAADLVNLGYVLNVIEDPRERVEVLRSAFDLATKVLVVSVRTEKVIFANSEAFSDGFLTGRGSFQKLYSHDEFKLFLEQSLEAKPYIASYGVAYLFKDQALASEFLAKQAFRPRSSVNLALIERLRSDPAANEVARIVEQLGRLPTAPEWPALETLKQDAGSTARLLRVIREKLNLGVFEETRTRKRSDLKASLLTLYLPVRKFPKIEDLPSDIQLDLEALWTGYRKACTESLQYLYDLGKPGVIKDACLASPVGKHLPDSLYIHRSALGVLPPQLKVILACAELIVGKLPCDLVKFKHHGRSLSFLFYERFDDDAHPELGLSIKVDLSEGAVPPKVVRAWI